MANSKISALTSASTPLAGTETLPVVQSGATKQVSVANLTAGRAVNASSITTTNDAVINGITAGRGLSSIAGNTVFGVQALGTNATGANNTIYGYQSGYSINSTQYNTFYGYQAGYNCTGSSNTFVGPNGCGAVMFGGSYNVILGGFNGYTGLDISTQSNYVVLSDGAGNVRYYNNGTDTVIPTGNIVIGTSGKGIDFSATPGTGTSELFADYEEGTWTPTIGDSLGVTFTMTAQNGTYTKIGRMVIVQFYIAYSSKGSASGGYYAHIRGWPFSSFYTGNKTGTDVAVFQPSLEISATAGRLSLYPSGDASNGVYTLLNGAGPQLVSFYPSSGSLQGTMIGFQ